MAQPNESFKHKKQSIENELSKLLESKAECEHCISILGSDEDTLQFRKTMTSHIRTATSLCRSIKSSFNKINDIHHEDIQSCQLTFISLHSQLKDIVNQIKIKTKQYEPHKNQPKSKSIINGSKSSSNVINNDDYKENKLLKSENNNGNNQLNELQQDFEDMKEVYTDLKQLKDNIDNSDKYDDNIVVKEILFEGWMDKKSRYLKSWRRRWVVLDVNTEDITLFTFKQKEKYIYPTESVIINDDISIQLSYSTENEFIISNTMSKAKFVFKALNRENRKQWVNILQEQQIKKNINPNNPIQDIQNIVIHPDNIDNMNNINVNDIKAKVNMDINIQNIIHNENILNGNHVMDNNMDNNMDVNAQSEYVSLKNELEPEVEVEAEAVQEAQIYEEEVEEVEPGAKIEVEIDEEPGAAPGIEPEPVTVNDKHELLSNIGMYDKSNEEVQDCLSLIDDLTHLRNKEDVDSENNKIINDFEHSLKHRGFVTKDQIDKLRDVTITLIGFMLDQDTIIT
eukprot:161539_1